MPILKMQAFQIYFKLLRITFQSMLQFRADFLIGLLGVITENLVSLLAISVVLGRFFDLAGWTVWEIVFLYGLYNTGTTACIAYSGFRSMI